MAERHTSGKADTLRDLTRSTTLCQAARADGKIRCLACPHGCLVAPGCAGICGVRFHRDGTLCAPHGYVSSLACDPVEKKPFYHFLPGEDVLSFGMLGCNLRCRFCQNWSISQVGRDPQAVGMPRECSAERIVAEARRLDAAAIASTYNEPLVSIEWMVEIFHLARPLGIRTCCVSNGFASPQALDMLMPVLDAMNIDLKCFTEAGYKELGGRLAPVLDTIRRLWSAGKWIEIITLLVPGFNDDDQELDELTQFIASVSADIPWHVSAYHPDYLMVDGPPRTSLAALERANAIGRANGLRHVYGGNMRGACGDTRCHRCDALLVSRRGFDVVRNELAPEGVCPACGERLAGIWRG